MSKLGWIVLALACLALGVYVFWPQPAEGPTWVQVWPGGQQRQPPATYELHANGLSQRVNGKTVTIGELTLPLGAEKANALWNQLQVLAVPQDQVVEGVMAADFAAYGIDPATRSLTCEELELAWGTKGNGGSVVDRRSHRLYAIGAQNARRLDALAGRLDAQQVVPRSEPQALTIDGIRVLNRGLAWASATEATRPAFTVRVGDILRLLQSLQVGDLSATVPTTARQVAAVRVEFPGSVALEGFPPIYDAKIFVDATIGGWLQVGTWPAQRLPPVVVAAWQHITAAFHEDRLFNIRGGAMGIGVERIDVTRGGQPWFSLESSNAKDLDDNSSRWDVVWSGGREYADPGAAERVIDALNTLSVTNPRPRLPIEPVWSDAIRVIPSGKMVHEDWSFEIRGREVRNVGYVAVAASLPALLDGIQPDRFLDPAIATRAPERVLKLQRRRFGDGTETGEVVENDGRGGWRRTWPDAAPVDPVAVQRIVRAMAAGRAVAVRLASEADRRLAETRSLEVAVRFGPKTAGKANDFTDLDETTTVDVGLAIGRIDGVWRGLSLGSGICYELDDDFVAALSADLASPLVMPLVPALVSRVALSGPPGGSTVALTLNHRGWEVTVDDQPEQPADEVECRRLLRDLAGLTASRRLPGGSLTGAELGGQISIRLPGAERDLNETLMLQFGRAGELGAGPDEVVVFAESTRMSALVRSRAVVPALAIAGYAPDAVRFRMAR